MYTLTQVERHRVLTTKISKGWGGSGWSPTRWIRWCLAHLTFFAEKWRNIFQFSSIPTEYGHGPYKRRLKNCLKGWSLVSPSMSLRHMHHCMSMNALEQGWDRRQPRPQTLMTLYEERPCMLCAKCFVLFVLVRDGGGVRDNYLR